MSNISYVSALSKNMKTLSYDTSKINSLNVPYNDFMSNSHNINDLSVLKLNNGNSVFGSKLSIPKSDSFTSQLNSNMKMATLAGTAMLGAVGGSVVNGNVNLNGQTGVSLGLVPLAVAVAGTLATLGYQCQNAFDIVGKLVSNPLTQSQKDNMILTEDEDVIAFYDATTGNYVLPKSTFGTLSQYIKSLGWLDSTGVDTRTGYYGLTKYNIHSVERNYIYGTSLSKYVPHYGVNIGTSGTLTFNLTIASSGESRQETILFSSSSDVYMDFWCYENEAFHVTLYSLNMINSYDSYLMVQNDKIYVYDWYTTWSKSELSTYSLEGWTGDVSPNQINYIDAYNQLKGSTNNASSSVINSVSNGVNTMSEIDNSRFIALSMSSARELLWIGTSAGSKTYDFSDYTFTSPVFGYIVRYVNTTNLLNTIMLILCSLSPFSCKVVDYYQNNQPYSYTTRTSDEYTVEGHTFYQLGTNFNPYLSDTTLAFPVVEYDCGGQEIPQNPIDPISDYVKWQLLNTTATPTNIGEGDSGVTEGLVQAGTAISFDSDATVDDIWDACESALPNTKFKSNVLSMFTPIQNEIAKEHGIAISLPTTMTETAIATVGAKTNAEATDYTDTGISSDAVARAIGATVTGVGITPLSKEWSGSVGKAISKAMSLNYTVADVEEPTQQELTDLIGTPTDVTTSGECNAMYSVYKLTQAELDSFGSWLWSSDFFTRVEKAWDNPMENIISLNKVYCELPTGTSGTVAIGTIDSSVTCKKITDRYTTVDFGSVNIGEYFGNMLDYAPYTDIQIYLPFIGIIKLDNADIMRGLVKLKYKIDLFTGDLLATISVYRDMVEQTAYQFNGNCAVAYPYSASNSLSGDLKKLGGITAMLGMTVATSGVGALAMGVAGASSIATASTNTQHSGNLNGSVGVLGSRTPYIIITRPQVVSTDLNKRFVGNANNIVDKISNHTGFIKVTEPQIQISGTKEEIDTITAMLQNGILV